LLPGRLVTPKDCGKGSPLPSPAKAGFVAVRPRPTRAALTQSGFSHDLAATMAGVPGGRVGFMLVSIVAFTVLGSLLEGIPAIVLFGPLLFPVARQFGINDVHYSMVVILAMGLGLFAPPFGLCYYAACIIGDIAPEAGMRRIWIYLAWLMIGLVAIAFAPWISTIFL